MFRTDVATASATLPTPAAAGTPGYFTNGNPGTGTPATVLDADWANMLQEELIAVVVAAGLTPSKTTRTQVRDAILALQSVGRTGKVFMHAANTAPAGALKANGAAVSRTTYASLFAVIGTVFGVGDGSTTFNLPDLRGEFWRGWDASRGIDVARVFGSAQTDDFKSHRHNVDLGGDNNGVRTPTDTKPSSSGDAVSGSYIGVSGQLSLTGGTETRPRNIALLACIYY